MLPRRRGEGRRIDVPRGRDVDGMREDGVIYIKKRGCTDIDVDLGVRIFAAGLSGTLG